MRTRAFRLVVALAALALPPMAPVAAGQVLGSQPLDLRGTWELEEHGDLRDPGKPLVQITQIGHEVVAEFLTGAHCKDGHPRTWAFVGMLRREPTLTELWSLSSTDMRVCSGSFNEASKCNGSIPTHYVTNFTNALAERDRISGSRMTLGRIDCTPDPSSAGTARFTLTRVTCPQEARKVAEREAALVALLASFLRARGIFYATIHDAEQRYGETYNGQPTTTIAFPYVTIDGDWEADMELTEQFFEIYPGAAVGSDYWARARSMLRQMASDPVNRLPEAQLMLDEIYRLEQLAPDGTRALDELRAARAELERCRRAQP
jgi:hypothetical protein